MKTAPLTLVAIASMIALFACNQPKGPQVVDANPDPMANALANAAPVELPPAIKSEQTFRCKDNSLVYVTFFQGGKQVNVRTEPKGAPTTLKTNKAGDPLVADGGWLLSGDEQNITIAQPDKPKLTCKS